MTDAEVWGEFAEMLAGAGVMPSGCCGLCDMLNEACVSQIISQKQWSRMRHQLWEAKQVGEGAFENCRLGYFWPPGKVKPRIAACRQLMREALERDGA